MDAKKKITQLSTKFLYLRVSDPAVWAYLGSNLSFNAVWLKVNSSSLFSILRLFFSVFCRICQVFRGMFTDRFSDIWVLSVFKMMVSCWGLIDKVSCSYLYYLSFLQNFLFHRSYLRLLSIWIFFNYLMSRKAIKPPRSKGLLGGKVNERTLVRRKNNRI